MSRTSCRRDGIYRTVVCIHGASLCRKLSCDLTGGNRGDTLRFLPVYGRILTFHLREGVKWHDGVPFTSEDVKWTYDTIIEKSWSRVTSLESVESIECPDDLTVVLHLKAADVTIIPKLGWYDTFILPKHIFGEAEDPEALFTQESSMIGTGPYKFDSRQTGVSFTLVKNEDFWGDEPILDKLIFVNIADEDTAY